MASLSIHQKQAKHNQKIAKKLSATEFRDWSAIACFYSALHYIESKFISNPKIGHTEELYSKLKGNTSTSEDIKNQSIHAFRDMLVGQEFPNLRSKFRHLKELGDKARYLKGTGENYGPEFITDAVIKKAVENLRDIAKETSN